MDKRPRSRSEADAPNPKRQRTVPFAPWPECDSEQTRRWGLIWNWVQARVTEGKLPKTVAKLQLALSPFLKTVEVARVEDLAVLLHEIGVVRLPEEQSADPVTVTVIGKGNGNGPRPTDMDVDFDASAYGWAAQKAVQWIGRLSEKSAQLASRATFVNQLRSVCRRTVLLDFPSVLSALASRRLVRVNGDGSIMGNKEAVAVATPLPGLPATAGPTSDPPRRRARTPPYRGGRSISRSVTPPSRRTRSPTSPATPPRRRRRSGSRRSGSGSATPPRRRSGSRLGTPPSRRRRSYSRSVSPSSQRSLSLSSSSSSAYSERRDSYADKCKLRMAEMIAHAAHSPSRRAALWGEYATMLLLKHYFPQANGWSAVADLPSSTVQAVLYQLDSPGLPQGVEEFRHWRWGSLRDGDTQFGVVARLTSFGTDGFTIEDSFGSATVSYTRLVHPRQKSLLRSSVGRAIEIFSIGHLERCEPCSVQPHGCGGCTQCAVLPDGQLQVAIDGASLTRRSPTEWEVRCTGPEGGAVRFTGMPNAGFAVLAGAAGEGGFRVGYSCSRASLRLGSDARGWAVCSNGERLHNNAKAGTGAASPAVLGQREPIGLTVTTNGTISLWTGGGEKTTAFTKVCSKKLYPHVYLAGPGAVSVFVRHPVPNLVREGEDPYSFPYCEL